MLLTFTLIISFLVAVNFLLLAFSCNKTTKKKESKKPVVMRQHLATTKQVSAQLSPTGS